MLLFKHISYKAQSLCALILCISKH